MEETRKARSGVDLRAYQWRKRLFLVFAPAPDDGGYQEQRRLLAGQERAFAARDLVWGALFEDSAGALGDRPLAPEDTAALRARLDVPGGRFAALLIGKDGGVKDRFDGPVAPADLYAQIDAMPMRRQESRERGR